MVLSVGMARHRLALLKRIEIGVVSGQMIIFCFWWWRPRFVCRRRRRSRFVCMLRLSPMLRLLLLLLSLIVDSIQMVVAAQHLGEIKLAFLGRVVLLVVIIEMAHRP